MTAKPACRACEDAALVASSFDGPCCNCGKDAIATANAIRSSCTHASPPSSEAGKWVPLEPTEDMEAPGEALIQGVIECTEQGKPVDAFRTARAIYKAMLAAAPSEPRQGAGKEGE